MNAPAFEPATAARKVLRSASTAALATLGEPGTPFASLVTVSTDHDGTPLMLLSTLAVHTRNLDRDPRCSLLLVAPGGEGGDPLAGARLTIEGRAERVPAGTGDVDRMRGRFLARHPAAKGYAGFADFGFFRLAVETSHLVAGFGRIHSVAPGRLIVGPDLAAEYAAAEAGMLDHLNEDHADTLDLYAARLLGRTETGWSAVAADPDGIDIAREDLVLRLAFPERQQSVMAVRFALKQMAEEARAV